MKKSEFIHECLLGGPGLDGYAYQADVYCECCTHSIIHKIADKIAPQLSSTNNPLFSDSETVPQPIFFGESDTAQYCVHCCKHLYGENTDEN